MTLDMARAVAAFMLGAATCIAVWRGEAPLCWLLLALCTAGAVAA